MAETRYVTVEVPVTFHGVVSIDVPASIPPDRRKALAGKVALARVIATVENPDAPEEDACQGYAEEFELPGKQAEEDWDSCMHVSMGGHWASYLPHELR
jgi:hypothetical protein